MASTGVKAFLLDIGGVLLTKGWDRDARKRAAAKFGLDLEEMQERHNVVFQTYETGRITIDEYLRRIVFYRERDFSPDEFKQFIYEQSQPYPDMLDFCKLLKACYNLKTVALSNEGREITMHRIQKFDLPSLIDFFVFSCFVRTRKPDPAMYSFAMDQVQLSKDEVIYIDDTPILCEVGIELGIPTICHSDVATTRAELEKYGLSLP
ncbi:MAG: HAD family phosphatase [Armatimonadota bacterium]|nr:HAD family phosphatase [bacterium]